ncbi:MAG: DUF3891 family protein [Dehalococcoidia bacterium]
MIVETVGKHIRLIAQDDHGRQCGEMAAAWGTPPFAPVSAETILAARLHDAGWREWDAAPAADPASGLPYRFYEMPLSDHLAIFGRGVPRAREEGGDLAGLLTSMHALGLYNGRYGLIPGASPRPISPADEPAVVRFVGEETRRQDMLRDRLSLSAIDPSLWTWYRLLQFWDALSLFSLPTEPRRRTLPPTPAADGDLTIEMRPRGHGEIVLDPWPFRGDSLETRIPARRIPASHYDQRALLTALAAAEDETIVVCFVRGG